MSTLTASPPFDPPIPPHLEMWRSFRIGGDTKTRKSRPVLQGGAVATDSIFGTRNAEHSHAESHSADTAGATWLRAVALTCDNVVGGTGIEPVTSSVSERIPGPLLRKTVTVVRQKPRSRR